VELVCIARAVVEYLVLLEILRWAEHKRTWDKMFTTFHAEGVRTIHQSWLDLFVPRTYDWTRTAVKLSVPPNSFLRSITCPIFPHSGIPFDNVLFKFGEKGP
jgi:hypothetical protein